MPRRKPKEIHLKGKKCVPLSRVDKAHLKRIMAKVRALRWCNKRAK